MYFDRWIVGPMRNDRLDVLEGAEQSPLRQVPQAYQSSFLRLTGMSYAEFISASRTSGTAVAVVIAAGGGFPHGVTAISPRSSPPPESPY